MALGVYIVVLLNNNLRNKEVPPSQILLECKEEQLFL